MRPVPRPASPLLLPLASAALSLAGVAGSVWLRHRAPAASALLAVAPVAAQLLWAVPWFRALDELQRRIQVHAFAAAAATVAGAGLGMEYLRGVGFAVALDWTSAFVATGVLYVTALFVFGRRYA
jgi:hypothetical protein